MTAPVRGLAPLTDRTPACRHCGGSDALRQVAFGDLDVTLCGRCAHAAEVGRLEYRLRRTIRRRFQDAANEWNSYGSGIVECSVDGGPWRKSPAGVRHGEE